MAQCTRNYRCCEYVSIQWNPSNPDPHPSKLDTYVSLEPNDSPYSAIVHIQPLK